MEAEALAPLVMEANIWPIQESKEAVVVPAAAAAAKAVAEVVNTAWKQSLAGWESQGSYRSQEMCDLSHAQWWQSQAATRRHVLDKCHVNGQET